MDQRIVTSARITTVIVSATLAAGKEISQTYQIRHEEGANEGVICGFAIKQLLTIGGILEDAPDGVTFYPIFIFMNGVKLQVQRVVLATPLPQ